jgi:hypothetical protein
LIHGRLIPLHICNMGYSARSLREARKIQLLLWIILCIVLYPSWPQLWVYQADSSLIPAWL